MANEENRYKKIECPECHQLQGVKILYGTVKNPEVVNQQKIGNIKLGGCVISKNSKAWYCNNCGYRWGNLER
jgi:CRISPR/Cas system-associated exonuclease Cas4 (RecB family)